MLSSKYHTKTFKGIDGDFRFDRWLIEKVIRYYYIKEYSGKIGGNDRLIVVRWY